MHKLNQKKERVIGTLIENPFIMPDANFKIYERSNEINSAGVGYRSLNNL